MDFDDNTINQFEKDMNSLSESINRFCIAMLEGINEWYEKNQPLIDAIINFDDEFDWIQREDENILEWGNRLQKEGYLDTLIYVGNIKKQSGYGCRVRLEDGLVMKNNTKELTDCIEKIDNSIKHVQELFEEMENFHMDTSNSYFNVAYGTMKPINNAIRELSHARNIFYVALGVQYEELLKKDKVLK